MDWQEKLNKKRLKTRGWYGCIAPNGWKTIIEETDAMLAYLDPDYEINQVKEKFGTLRYYYEGGKTQLVRDIMDAVVRLAEYESAYTCEGCGNSSRRSDSSKGIKWDDSAVTKVRNGWYKTICDTCAPEGYASTEKLEKLDSIADMEIYISKVRETIEDGQDPLDLYLKIAKKDLLGE